MTNLFKEHETLYFRILLNNNNKHENKGSDGQKSIVYSTSF